MDLSLEVLKFILSELLITHFDLAKHELKGEDLHLYFEEKKAIPEEFSKDIVISHGFHKEIMVEDFPLRGKVVLLHIKRRRWLNKTINKVVYRNWNLIVQGTRMTVEFAVFLKALNQY
ncbi:ISAon1 family transposase N-terminal region protein [Tenacibaculum maritimum]|uniref:ISAon1 family transposase N-terminal region protein n=2 Tax=Tenacibaculum maritimum TaxID=107401 RepID=UPI00132F8CAC|nr:transposase [Tenacibaculum maritimum]MCD9563383.1 transposase [Tenacibaculum maritimum]MCD9566575.1 transposase [Tenacibaculum maritimum]MCD9579624.1 transposase [Tenacibaculum maritimum]MCD9582228.1 transposase [Tenacibaculum maritimum]MCD9597002.1 transposase [Tenacibaculum maritimum]